MSFIDWNASALPSAIQGQNTANNQGAFGLMQAQRARSALSGVDLGDSGSVNSALTGLLKAGALDQAKSLTELAMTRGVNSATLPVIQNALKLASDDLQSGDQSSDTQQAAPSAPTLDSAHQQILQKGADAVNDLLATSDPGQRATKAAAYKQQFAAMGVPQQNVDEVLGDLSEGGLKAHAAYLEAAANGQDAEHPTGHAASQSVFNANNPGGEQAISTLQGHLANPVVQAALKRAGIDVGPGVDQAISITAPARGAAASAPYTPVSAEGPQGQTESMSAANFASGQSQPGAAPIVGATPGAKAAQSAAANAPFTPVTTTNALGQPSVQSAAQFAEGRGAPQVVGTPTGPTDAPPITGPSPQTQGLYNAGAAQLATDRAANAASMPQQVALHKVLDLLPDTNTGPGTQAVNGWRSFVLSQLPVLAPLIPGGLTAAQVQTANANELKKYMIQISSAAAAQFGQGTDQKLAVAASGNPNTDMDALSARDVTRTTLALKRAELARTQLFDQQHPDPADAGQYGQWAANFATKVDPRAFMLDMMTAAERQKMLAGITSPSDKRRFAQGVIDAEQAGFINRADLPK